MPTAAVELYLVAAAVSSHDQRVEVHLVPGRVANAIAVGSQSLSTE